MGHGENGEILFLGCPEKHQPNSFHGNGPALHCGCRLVQRAAKLSFSNSNQILASFYLFSS